MRLVVPLLLLASVFPNAVPAASMPGEVEPVAATTPIDRQAAATALIRKWAPQMIDSGVESLDEWRAELTSLVADADPGHLDHALRADVYAAMLNALHGRILSDDEAMTRVAERAEALGLTPAQMKAFGDTDKDLIYVPVNACRIADTRVAGGGVIAANTIRSFDVTAVSNYSFQGGDASNCGGAGAAGSFAAAVLRMTVVTPAAAGYITAFPFGGSQPLTATLNYEAGVIDAATSIVRLDQGAAANELSVYTFAQTHLVVDIVGYFQNPGVPTLECVNSGDTVDSVAAGATRNTVAPACPASYTQTATNCESSTWQMPFVYFADGTCSAQNNSSGTAQLRASRTCCRPKFN